MERKAKNFTKVFGGEEIGLYSRPQKNTKRVFFSSVMAR